MDASPGGMRRIELDTVRKAHGQIEYRPINRARCDGYEAVGDGAVIRQLCKAMLEDGQSGDVQVLERGVPQRVEIARTERIMR